MFSYIIIIAALPSIYFFYRWVGRKRALLILPVFIGLTFFIEGFGIATGFPYGHFYYTELLGFKLFGLVPWSVPFAFIPLLIGCYVIAHQFVKTPWKLVLFSALLLVLFDMVLDPALVLLNIWVWVTPGLYYGVPITNYLGWFLTGITTSSLLSLLLPKNQGELSLAPPLVSVSLLFTLSFWSGFTLWTMLWIPYSISVLLLLIIFPVVGLNRQLLDQLRSRLLSRQKDPVPLIES
jgi:putative membrane protein